MPRCHWSGRWAADSQLARSLVGAARHWSIRLTSRRGAHLVSFCGVRVLGTVLNRINLRAQELNFKS